jgi:flavin-dependent thymidylate synthase
VRISSIHPRVTLTKYFVTPFDNSVATARTCYSSRIVSDDDVRADPKMRDRIARSTYVAGHHTTLQHAHFQFAIANVSRHALWSFFHAHPFYNSEQVSQRYVEVRPGNSLVPHIDDVKAREKYDACIARQMAVYQELLALLEPAASELYYRVYPARKKRSHEARWRGAIKKRCQEVARYVLPVATHAHLYHTISGLTLHRYHRLAAQPGCPSEQRLIVDAMCRAVGEIDPLFLASLEETLPGGEDPIMGTPDSAFAVMIRSEFDAEMAGRSARLISHTVSPESMIQRAVCEALSRPAYTIPSDEAVSLLLDPSRNSYLSETLSPGDLVRAMQALETVHFTFAKKLSHSADSQAQRHRMTPGVRPLLHTRIVPGDPDFITPSLFDHDLAENARDLFTSEMRRTWDDIAFLVDRSVRPEAWQYLLPNAVAVRFTETGSLLHWHHKWTTRLCLNSQEEIWRSTVDEVRAVRAVSPSIARWLMPPCGIRSRSGVSPACPEGDRYCGVPAWKKETENIVRLL